MREREKEENFDNCSTVSSLEMRLPVTSLGRGVALVKVTDPPTAIVMEDEVERRMEVDSTDISPPATVKLVSLALS